jgi:hypothetical protein
LQTAFAAALTVSVGLLGGFDENPEKSRKNDKKSARPYGMIILAEKSNTEKRQGEKYIWQEKSW